MDKPKSTEVDKAWRDRITKQIFDNWQGYTPVPSDDPNFNDVLAKMKEVTRLAKQIAPSEPEIDYEPVQLDRRTDLDYIEKLTSDHKLLVMVLAELVSQGKADFLFIEYPEIQEIWHRHCNNLGKLRAKEREQKRIRELKESGLSKLTEAEKKALGIK
jgi:hypothetical protein